ncbi:GNAT family acetyltransferase [Enterococcus canis]|uniref:GNAT family acetyltransferase n=1 Tax=Enterococcus canis TaxID=214095 RepID=A0A1L8RFJ4_9ENTE|nr:GNAT family N-acetyltransferase [Enterococcus canis]OJG18465.1 GNAT family acetyltransferase [Enterococcus canis]
MYITAFERENVQFQHDLAELLAQTWPQSYGEDSLAEVARLLEPEKIAIAAIVDEELVGFAGAAPMYGKTGWELHPLVIVKQHQRSGVGSHLLHYLEKEVKSQGGITLYLGTDDEQDQTSLSGKDLYPDLLTEIRNIQNKADHPYTFYQKQGYQIVGVLPDVNGWGKPDIWMAKRL